MNARTSTFKPKCDVPFPRGTPVNIYNQAMNNIGFGIVVDWNQEWDYKRNQPHFKFQVQLEPALADAINFTGSDNHEINTITVDQAQLAFAHGCPVSVNCYEGKSDNSLQSGTVVGITTGLYRGSTVISYFRVALTETEMGTEHECDLFVRSSRAHSGNFAIDANLRMVKCLPKHVFYRHIPPTTSTTATPTPILPELKILPTCDKHPKVYCGSYPKIAHHKPSSANYPVTSTVNSTTKENLVDILFSLKHEKLLFQNKIATAKAKLDSACPTINKKAYIPPAIKTLQAINKTPLLPTKEDAMPCHQLELHSDHNSVSTGAYTYCGDDDLTVPDEMFVGKEPFTWPVANAQMCNPNRCTQQPNDVSLPPPCQCEICTVSSGNASVSTHPSTRSTDNGEDDTVAANDSFQEEPFTLSTQGEDLDWDAKGKLSPGTNSTPRRRLRHSGLRPSQVETKIRPNMSKVIYDLEMLTYTSRPTHQNQVEIIFDRSIVLDDNVTSALIAPACSSSSTFSSLESCEDYDSDWIPPSNRDEFGSHGDVSLSSITTKTEPEISLRSKNKKRHISDTTKNLPLKKRKIPQGSLPHFPPPDNSKLSARPLSQEFSNKNDHLPSLAARHELWKELFGSPILF